MTDSHPANQPHYRVLREHVADHPIRLALIQPAPRPARDDPACILSAMLQQRQTLTYLRRSVDGGVVQEEAKDSTHCEGGEADEVEMEARKEKQRASLVLFTLSSEVETWRIVCKCDLSTHISVNKFLLRAAIHRMHARVEKAGSHDTIASRRSSQIIMMQYVHIPYISLLLLHHLRAT